MGSRHFRDDALERVERGFLADRMGEQSPMMFGFDAGLA